MTVGKRQQPQMSIEDFEELERRAPETVRLEFINGKVVVKPMPDGNHSEIVACLQRVCMQHLPDLWLHAERGLKGELVGHGDSPDGRRGDFVGRRCRSTGPARQA